MQKLKMEALDSSPSVSVFDIGNTKDKKKKWITKFSENIAFEYVDLSAFNADRKVDHQDHVHEYAKEIMSLGLFYMEYQDAIREGDGDRVFNCWKYMLIMFRATSHWNYALEAFTLLAQYQWLLPERQAMQLKQSRFINTQGRIGCNIPCDMYMEHLNRMVKASIANLGANKTPKSIEKVGKCIGPIDEIIRSFDSHQIKDSMHHSIPSSNADRDKIIKELLQYNLFLVKQGREFRCFKKFKSNVMNNVDKEKMVKWMMENYKKMLHQLILESLP